MAVPSRDWTLKAYELLADGEWRDRDWVERQVMPTIPPGIALRFAERQRLRQLEGFVARRRDRSVDYQIQVGRKGIVTQLFSMTRIERKTEDGKRWVRLRPVRPDPRTQKR